MPRKRAISPDRVFVDARPALAGPIVKSAQRVIELFELFSDLRTGITVADVAARLKMPQSSTSALLRSLHTLGYLALEEAARTYSPTSRVALLGLWIDPLLAREGPVIAMTRAVTARTGFDGFLAIRNRLHVQVVHRQNAAVLQSHSLTGAGAFLVSAATGQVLMADLPDREVTRIVIATNAELPADTAPMTPRDLHAQLARVRAEGFATGHSPRSPDTVRIAVRLPCATVEPMAFGINVPRHLAADPARWATLMHEAIREHLGAPQAGAPVGAYP